MAAFPAAAPQAADETGGAPAPVPVIHCTDLFHPHEDPDDHFDLATLYALPQLDVKGIVLDQGERQARSPGRIPVSQLNHLTGRTIPATSGLGRRLTSPADTGADQPGEFQGGVRFILDTLRRSAGRVAFIAVGSMRDLTAAFNRDPALFRHKAGRILCFIGEASKPDFREYNVGLDPHAFVGLMRSGLDLYWVPCFDGGVWQNQGHASFWRTRQEALLSNAPPELIQFFIYALEKEKADPIGFLREPPAAARKAALFAMERNLWCTAIFASLAGQSVAFRNSRFGLESTTSAAEALFGFEPIEARIADDARVTIGPGPGAARLHCFKVLDQARYPEGMTRATAAILARFPVSKTQTLSNPTRNKPAHTP